MSFDYSRSSFQPWNDFLGVVMQQGRVQLDSDWNELVTQLTRRIQAGTFDTVGKAVVPRETPDGFLITYINPDQPNEGFNIGVGRMYVDGLLVENHGSPPYEYWDENLAESKSNVPVPFFKQPYYPFAKKSGNFPREFGPPELTDKHYLVYLDVWQRELTSLQKPELIEPALGVDTTGRLQIVWQVKILPIDEDATCTSKDNEIPKWKDLIKPSGARLTTSTGAAPVDPNPCLVPPSAGYRGLENQLYRVEIHKGGKQDAATFKWSRDNATVATRVTKIPSLKELVVENVKRDDLLGFKGGDWIEIMDDRHELQGHPGILRRIKGDGTDTNSNTLTLETDLPGNHFPVDADGFPIGGWHLRVRRWDQSGVVRLEDGTAVIDLDSSTDADEGIPLPSVGNKVMLEDGILVDFSLENGLEFKAGDYWVFAARSADGTIEILDRSPPKGIHHHYSRLAIVNTRTRNISDCRTHWPPAIEGNSCDCTVCVSPETHNNKSATIQNAIEIIKGRGGGTLCLDAGTYRITEPLIIRDAKSIRIRGQGLNTLLLGNGLQPVFGIENCHDVSVQNLTAINSAIGQRAGTVKMVSLSEVTSVIAVKNTADFTLDHVNAFCISTPEVQRSLDEQSAALSLSGYLINGKVNSCALAAQDGVALVSPQAGEPSNYLGTADLKITDCFLFCERRGISFEERSFHHSHLLISNNLILGCKSAGIMLTGGALPGSLVRVEKNLLKVSGTGIRCGLDGMHLLDNVITSITDFSNSERSVLPGDGIVVDSGIDPGPINLHILGNHIHNRRGHGIVIQRSVEHGMIKSNMIEYVNGSGFLMKENGSFEHLSIENNHFLNIGPNSNNSEDIYAAIWLVSVKSADFVGNVMDGIARNSSNKSAIVGLLSMACNELRISGNRLQNIGSGKTNKNVGIECVFPFQHLSIQDNIIILDVENIESDMWAALFVGSYPNTIASQDKSVAKKIGDYFLLWLPHKSQAFYIGRSRLASIAHVFGSTGIHKNRFISNMGQFPSVIITNVGTCLFTENFCEVKGEQEPQSISLLGGNQKDVPLATIQGGKINASNNSLVRDKPSRPVLDIITQEPDKNLVLLGNMCSGQIWVNGNNLKSPWSDLNQTPQN